MKPSRQKSWAVDAAGTALCAAIVASFFFAGVRPLLHARTEAAAQKMKLEQQRHRAVAAQALVRSQAAKLAGLRAALAADPLALQESRFINGKLAKISVLA